MNIIMETIRRFNLNNTVLVIQRGRDHAENLVLVRPIFGDFIGRLPINAGITP